MKNIFIMVILFTLTIFPKIAVAENCDAKCQLSQINAYFSALDKVSRKGSSVEDIDALLSLTDDTVNYVHVEYQANFTKESWRKAFKRNLARGAYQNSDKNEMRILNHIVGKNHTAIEYSHGVVQADGTWQPTEPLLVVFGFTNGKISLLKELW